MKKLISILVVFAVLASAVIAQEGSWSVGGSGEISTIFNFVPREVPGDPDSDPAPVVGVHAYNNYGYYGASTGSLNLTYSNGDLSAGLSFDPSDNIYGDLKYDSGDIAFNLNVSFMELLQPDFNKGVGRLWGYFKFLDGAIHIETAMNSRDTNYWISNEVVGNVFDSAARPDIGAKFDIGWGFMSVDHHNYLLADFNLSSIVDGLSLGFMLPGVFNYTDTDNTDKWKGGAAKDAGWGNTSGYHPVGYATDILLKDAFKLIRFGVKYASGPVNAAVQFSLAGPTFLYEEDPDSTPNSGDEYPVYDADAVDSGLYFGLDFAINDQMKAGIGLEGRFDGDNSDKNRFAFGASFSYGDGPFSAKLEGGLYFGDSEDKGFLGLRPNISYNLVDNYLNITLGGIFLFNLDSDEAKVSGLYYEITPELSFNVAGTGAGQGYYWPNATAIILRYKVAGWSEADDPSINAVDITFKWSF